MPGNPGMAPQGREALRLVHAQVQRGHRRAVPGQGGLLPRFDAADRVLARRRRGIPKGARHARSRAPRAAAIFYIDVSREESWRRNVARYQEKLRHSILAHMVPRETYDYFYDVNDWADLTGGQPVGLARRPRPAGALRDDEQRAGVNRSGRARRAVQHGPGAAVGAAERAVTGDSTRPPIFEHLFVLGRPAGGKSEFIDFMKTLRCRRARARLRHRALRGGGRLPVALGGLPRRRCPRGPRASRAWSRSGRRRATTSRGRSSAVHWSIGSTRRSPRSTSPTPRSTTTGTLLIEFARGARRRVPREPGTVSPGDPRARRDPVHQGVVRGVVPPQLRALQARTGRVDPLSQGARP